MWVSNAAATHPIRGSTLTWTGYDNHADATQRNVASIIWFIDPPYQNGGECYVEIQIDFDELAAWCNSQKGQVIVCENVGEAWMTFRTLVSSRGTKHTRIEMIWTN